MLFKTKIYKAVQAALLPALAMSTTAHSAEQSEDASASPEKIIITGSRIKRTEIEGANTVVSITAEEMQQQGFTNLHEALSTVTSSIGSFAGEQNTSGFQPNAQGINLRGLGPGRTLILLDGRRIADYPSPYNGASNFTNLAQIPMAMVSHVEIMAGGASAIYGSDAMAGVVNIITHDKLETSAISARFGDTERGGGASSRLQWFGGTQGKNVSNIWAVEIYDVDPIIGADRPRSGLQDLQSALDYYWYDFQTSSFVDIDQQTCDNFGYQYDDSQAIIRCRQYSDQYKSLRNDKRRLNIFDRVTFDQGDYSQLFLEVHLWDIEAKSNSGPLFWQPGIEFYSVDEDTFEQYYTVVNLREFTQTEADSWSTHNEHGADVKIGFEGLIDQIYDYEVVLTHSFQESEEKQTLLKEEAILEFYRGPQGGTFMDGTPYYFTDFSNYGRQLTEEEMAFVSGEDISKKHSGLTSLSFVMSGDLMEFGDDYAQFATIIEAANQTYEIDLHPRTLNSDGNGWVGRTGTEGDGSRNRYAIGLETRWPLTSEINLTAAGRYDKYDDETAVDDAITYNLGFEYRPVDGVLLRASTNSNFRAPDMHFIYANEGGAYNGSVFGYGVSSVTQGSLDLEEETGTSSSVGFVYEPINNLSFSIDVYEIELEGLVEFERADWMAYVYGLCFNNDPDAENNPYGYTCDLVNERVTFDTNGFVVETYPVNTSLIKQLGVDTSFKYNFTTDNWGRFAITANHTNILKAERQTSEFSERDTNWRENPANPDLRSRFRGSLTWSLGGWRTTLFANRIGSFNYQENRESYTTYNMSTSYAFSTDLTVDLIVNNLTKEYPRYGSADSWPFFDRQHYNAVGREFFIEAKYEF